MPIELEGNVSVHGRFGSLQVVADTTDTEIAVPASSTHVDIHQETQYSGILYSLGGAVNSWRPLPPAARDYHTASSFRIALGAATKVYLRKARQIRQISFRSGLSGHFKGVFDASAGMPPLVDGDSFEKDYYSVSVGGTYDFGSGGIALVAGDWVIYTGGLWIKATSDPREGLCDDVIGKVTVVFQADT